MSPSEPDVDSSTVQRSIGCSQVLSTRQVSVQSSPAREVLSTLQTSSRAWTSQGGKYNFDKLPPALYRPFHTFSRRLR